MFAIANGDTAEINKTLARSLHCLTGRDSTSGVMAGCLALAQKACDSSAPVLIVGEKGTGKSLMALSIHYASALRDRPCVVVNCAEDAIDGTLFGVARRSRGTTVGEGALAKAGEGSVVVENIDALPPATLSAVLAMIEYRRYQPVESDETRQLKARVIATSSPDPPGEPSKGCFREDAGLGLGEFVLRLPPLRERREDIPFLAREMIRQANRQYGKRITGITKPALKLLLDHPFPGNIRELRHYIIRAVNASRQDLLRVKDLGIVLDKVEDDPHVNPDGAILPLPEMEKRHIAKTLARCNWNRNAAARLLHITPASLQRKIVLYTLGG